MRDEMVMVPVDWTAVALVILAVVAIKAAPDVYKWIINKIKKDGES